MSQRLPPELENKLARYQNLQAQFNRIVQERAAVEAEISEINRVLQVLQELEEGDTVYRLLGNVLVKVSKDKVVSELNDRKEILELRLQKLRKQENELRKQLDEVVQEIKKLQTRLLGVQQGGGG
ncbi:MAG: prefoldin subunit beta [Pyrodictiaceae archaeon]